MARNAECFFLAQTSPGTVTARFCKEGMRGIQSYHSEMQSYHLVYNPIIWRPNPVVWCAILSFGFFILFLSSAILSFSSLPDLFHKRAETFVMVSEGGEPTSRAYLIDLINTRRSFAGYAVHCLACATLHPHSASLVSLGAALAALRATARAVRSFICSHRHQLRISS